MFDRIAPVYDRMNRLMTAGLDRRWRDATARRVVEPGDCGARRGLRNGRPGARRSSCRRRARVGVDFSEPMLERARRKSGEWSGYRETCRSSPTRRHAFQAATIGFGLRNVSDLDGALRELRRVLAPGGRLGILEITRPRGPLAPFYRLWFDLLVPLRRKAAPRRIGVRLPARQRDGASRPLTSSPSGWPEPASSRFATAFWPAGSWRCTRRVAR